MQKEQKKIKLAKDEPGEYVFKKSRWMKAKRLILWIILLFFLYRGIITTLRPDQTAEVTQMIEQFKVDIGNYKNQDAEIMSFAQNFTKEYLTYHNRDEEEYKERIKQYVTDRFYSSSIMDFNGNAEALYVQAYRKEDYSSSQYDVFVKASVEYTIPTLENGNKTYTNTVVRKNCILKVPVYVYENQYVVEDLPMFVNDDIKFSEYVSAVSTIPEVTSDEIKKSIESSLSSFFKAYYEQDQNVINYYLTRDADTNKFIGLSGRMLFSRIEDLKCYQDIGSEDITCVIKIKVNDGVNGVMLYQQLNVVVTQNNDKYYIVDMDTKTGNLNINNSTEEK